MQDSVLWMFSGALFWAGVACAIAGYRLRNNQSSIHHPLHCFTLVHFVEFKRKKGIPRVSYMMVDGRNGNAELSALSMTVHWTDGEIEEFHGGRNENLRGGIKFMAHQANAL